MRSSLTGLSENPEAMRKINGWLFLFWLANIPAVVLLYFFARPLWDRISILYLAITAVYSIVGMHQGGWQTAVVACKQADDADVQEVLDVVLEKREPA